MTRSESTSIVVVVISGLLISGVPTVAQPPETGFVSLFNGEDLSGWEGDKRFWSVEDEAIVGQTTPDNPTKKNTFLVYQGDTVDDFELRFSYRVKGGNSGIQYRSELLSKWVVKGLQADFEDRIHEGKDSVSGQQGTQ